MEAMGMMRDLDQIRERDEGRESSRLVLIGLGGLAVACVLFAAGVLIGRDGEASAHTTRHGDPLARLDALAGQVADAGVPAVTYPDRLIDPPAAAEGAMADGAIQPGESLVGALTPSGPMGARAGSLGAAPGGPVMRIVPASAGTRAAGASASSAGATGGMAPPGSDGAFTLQISSFRALAPAQSFAQRLREHGHRAFVLSGPAMTGGTIWHRVRIGPFASLRDANRYRSEFETRERLPTFVVRQNAEIAHGG
jgi:cell division septation protein DedD